MTTRTRFAPSPTGYLHVGGARTALFCYLQARTDGGEFILRIEDTDLERSTAESTQAILDAMEWLGLDYDAGPFYQSKRFDRYGEQVEALLDKGRAYRCYCSKDRLAELRESQMAAGIKPRYDGRCRELSTIPENIDPVIRFRNPDEGEVRFIDRVHGDLVFSNEELDDLVIARPDGSPTYNFTVVVDDIDMKISLVIRGDDHINNTPRQVNIYQALDAAVPDFAHVPMILGDDGARLSKRHGAVSVMQYRDEGYLPEALLNYLVRLGWSHGDQEVFSLEEMVSLFDIADVNKKASSFNTEKLNWLNQHWLRTLDADVVAGRLAFHFDQAGIDSSTGPRLQDLIAVQADRVKTLRELAEQSRSFYEDFEEYDPGAAKKHLRPVAAEPLSRIREVFAGLEDWTVELLDEAVKATAESMELNMGKIAQPLRVSLTGSGMSPSIGATLWLTGRERSLARIDRGLAFIAQRAAASE
jgi:glutamyl-tRNA synthetase